MKTLLDEIEAPRKTYMVIAAIALVLAAVKVKNELRMTEMYERQAVALERQAGKLERIARAQDRAHPATSLEDLMAGSCGGSR